MRVIQTDEIETFRAQFHSLLDEMLDKLFFVGMEETPPSTEQPPLQGELVVKTIEAIKDTFLDEINQPIIVSDEPETTPDVPDLRGIEPLKEPANPNLDEYVEQLKAEHVANGGTLQTVEISEIPDQLWERFAKTIILAGWDVERLKTSDTCKGVKFAKSELSLLEQLAGIRSMMLEKQMDLATAKSQDGLGEIEKDVLTVFAAKNNLK